MLLPRLGCGVPGWRSAALVRAGLGQVSVSHAARRLLSSTGVLRQDAQKSISLTINGRECQASEGQTVLEAARDNNMYIPTLCYHPSLKPVGTCRLCLVDVGEKKTVPACVTSAKEGMDVLTHTEDIEKEVHTLLSLLRARHPMKCATCPVNGHCEFQDLLMRYQVEESSFFGHEDRKSAVGRTHDHSSPGIQLDLDKCVLCTRCVRACQELQGMSILGIASRGPYESVSPIMGKPISETPCITCGACAAVCPVGAITEKPHLFQVLHLLEGDFTHHDLVRDDIVRMGGLNVIRQELAQARHIKTVGHICEAQRKKREEEQEAKAEAKAEASAGPAQVQSAGDAKTGSSAKHRLEEDGGTMAKGTKRLRRPITVVHTAPAVRVTLGEAFGMEPGTISTGRLVSALRALGFDYVFDTNFTADLTIMEEATELLERVKTNGLFPMMTSCCPGWINMVERTYPELIPHLSSAKSPQQMMGAMAKTYFARSIGVEPEDIRVVSMMPCTAKKDEAHRSNMTDAGSHGPDVDYVLTTRELGNLIRMHRPPIHFNNLPEERYDSILGESTGSAQIFGVTGGVMEAALRTAMALTASTEATLMPRLEFEEVRGLEGVRQATVDLNGTELRVAVANGGTNLHKVCREILRAKHRGDEPPFHFVELMACRGGCIGGAGNPKDSITPDLLQRRARAVYSIDERSKLRRSHENPEIKRIYDDFLDHPLSEASEKLLHTTYTDRLTPDFHHGEHLFYDEDSPDPEGLTTGRGRF